MSGIDTGRRALQFSEQRQAGPCDPHVVHGLVVAAFGRDHIRRFKNIGETLGHLRSP